MAKKVYDTEFKQTIVSLYESGKTLEQLKDEFNISTSSINRWRKTHSTSTKAGSPVISEETKRIKLLEKELKRTQLERDILKKAVNIFAKSDR